MKKLIKRFGTVAVEKGFITKEQFVEAMGMQIENELEGIQPKLTGDVLVEMGYLTQDQVREVLRGMAKRK